MAGVDIPGVLGPILVVDDDDQLRKMVVWALGAQGIRATAATDGADALTMIRRGDVAPSLILLDWRMPTPGDVFAREYRSLPGPHAPIVVVTAVDGAEAARAAEEIGASGFLCKPLEIDELLEMVGRLAEPPSPARSDAVAASARPATRRSARPRVGPATGDKARREAALRRLAVEVQRIRTSLDAGRQTLHELLDVERQRRLTSEESERVRRLRWESERLRWELSLLREEFEQLRTN